MHYNSTKHTVGPSQLMGTAAHTDLPQRKRIRGRALKCQHMSPQVRIKCMTLLGVTLLGPFQVCCSTVSALGTPINFYVYL